MKVLIEIESTHGSGSNPEKILSLNAPYFSLGYSINDADMSMVSSIMSVKAVGDNVLPLVVPNIGKKYYYYEKPSLNVEALEHVHGWNRCCYSFFATRTLRRVLQKIFNACASTTGGLKHSITYY